MDLQEKHYLCKSNQAFCNIYGEILCQSSHCTWMRTFHKKTEKDGTRPKTKASEIKRLTFSFRLSLIVKRRLVPFKMNSRWYSMMYAWCLGKWKNATDCNELESTITKPLKISGFFICPKSGYVQSDIVVRHIFLPYFYHGTFSGFAPMSRWRSSWRVLTMVYVYWQICGEIKR